MPTKKSAGKAAAPTCPVHGTKLICPRCIAATGGRATASKHSQQSEWGKMGGRPKKD